jgi:hypothetical protein
MDMAEPILPARDETATKYISFEDSIAIKCMLQYIDFEGLTDGRSIRNILAKIAPRKLVCVLDGVVLAEIQSVLSASNLPFILIDHRSWHAASNRASLCCAQERDTIHQRCIYA